MVIEEQERGRERGTIHAVVVVRNCVISKVRVVRRVVFERGQSHVH